jgi:hypothetical protein
MGEAINTLSEKTLKNGEPYYAVLEISRNPAYSERKYEVDKSIEVDYDNKNLDAIHIFDKGTILEKRRDCLAFIEKILECEPNESGRTDFQGNPIPQFDMGTYAILGSLAVNGKSFPIYSFFCKTWGFMEPYSRAYSLLEESRILRSYYEDEDETDKSPTDKQIIEKKEPYFMVTEESFNPDFTDGDDGDPSEQEWEFPYNGDVSPSAFYSYSDVIQLLHPFNEGTLLEKRCKCLELVINLMKANPNQHGRHGRNKLPDGKPIPDFHLDTYCVKGYMIDNDTAYPFFYFANDYALKPYEFADNLLTETEYMIRYYESDKNAPVASDEAEN